MKKNYFETYNSKLKNLLTLNSKTIQSLNITKSLLKTVKKKKKKVLIFGNGGSAAIASHFTIDLLKNTKIRCINFNESRTASIFNTSPGTILRLNLILSIDTKLVFIPENFSWHNIIGFLFIYFCY